MVFMYISYFDMLWRCIQPLDLGGFLEYGFWTGTLRDASFWSLVCVCVCRKLDILLHCLCALWYVWRVFLSIERVPYRDGIFYRCYIVGIELLIGL